MPPWSPSRSSSPGPTSTGTFLQEPLRYASADVPRGCTTPKVIANVKEFVDGDLTMIDGYEDLPEDMQAKLDKAFAQGHVDDEDWKGVSTLLFSLTTWPISMCKFVLWSNSTANSN